MTRLERYKRDVAELERRYSRLLGAGKITQALQLSHEISEIKTIIAEAEECEQFNEEAEKPKAITEIVSRQRLRESGLVTMLIECHLAADYLTDCAYNVKDTMDGMGLITTTIIPEIEEITKLSESVASAICKISDKLSDLMTDNDTLIVALHKKTLSYINQRLKDEPQ